MLVYIGSSSLTKNIFYLQLNCLFRVINVPWYNNIIFSRWHGLLFYNYVTTDKRERYNLRCLIEDHEINHKYVNDEASSGGGRPIPLN